MRKIVALSEIPTEIIDTPTDNLVGVYNFCEEMKRLCIAEKGVGLSAVQVGVPWRLFIAIKSLTFLGFRYFVDCKYLPVGEEKVASIEGCLSVRNSDGECRRFKVDRHKGIDLIGKEILANDKLKLVDVNERHYDDLAIVYQHEIDHASGITINQIGQEISIW